MNKNKTVLLIIALVLTLGSVVGYSFAFVNRNHNKDFDIDLYTNVKNKYGIEFLSSNDPKLTLDVTLDDLSFDNIGKKIEGPVSKTNLSLETSEEKFPNGAICKYQIIYRPVTSYIPSAEAKENDLNELMLNGVCENCTTLFNASLDNVDEETLLYELDINSKDSHEWQFNYEFNNYDFDQSSVVGQSPQGLIVFKLIECNANEGN